MATEKKVRFTAQEDITPLIKKLRQESEQLGRDLIRDARAYSKSGKESLQYIEDQIKAIERRGKADKESRIAELDVARSKGGISEGSYKRKVSEIQGGSKVEEQQVLLLRELIDTVKAESRREIAEDRKNVEKRLKRGKGEPEDELTALKRDIQKEEIEKTRGGRQFDRAGAELRVQRLAGAAQNIIGSENVYQATTETFGEIAKSIATKFPGIGTLLNVGAQYAGKAISASKPYEDALAGISRITGRSQQSYYGRFGELTDIGLDPAQSAALTKDVSLARGGFSGSIGAARRLAYLEKGAGVDRNLLLEQERLTRSGGAGSYAGTQGLVGRLQGAGVMQGQDMSLLNEYLPILISLQREQVQIAGETNNAIAENLVAGIASLDESFNNPDVLKTLIPSLRGDVRGSATPQGEAFKFMTISRMDKHQGKSFTELQEIMEDPGMDEIEALRQGIINRFGTGEAGIQATKGLFQQTYGKNTKKARKFITGELGAAGKGLGIAGLGMRAGEDYGTGDIEKSVAQFNKHFQETGIKLVDSIDDLATLMTDTFKDALSVVRETSENMAKAEKDRKESYQALKESASAFERAAGSLVESSPVGYRPGR